MTRGPAIDGLELLHLDEDLVVVAKPAGLAVHRGWARDRDTALARARDAIGAWVYPVHRLDRPTSGLLLFARSPGAARDLQVALGAEDASKCYVALVRGVPAPEGLIESPVPRAPGGPRVPAATRYRTLATTRLSHPELAKERAPDDGVDGPPTRSYSLVAAWPRTGRLHQIRRHLKHLGHPLVGDVRYGRGEHNRAMRQAVGLDRLALHALHLELTHPTTGRRLALSADVPADLADPLTALGLGPTLEALARRLSSTVTDKVTAEVWSRDPLDSSGSGADTSAVPE